ncbi:Histone acetyltransferase complex subunit [Steccherinum ochraceum]|uniref:Histone acetyltransferase complex subunit n=1 Tax=Steccherinum ochraceum TaxID=92696 RepID=A0A4R0RA30_9APHY|nr:Histone acetyltransferase complex subunit [Steccherinum ochraceum]
MSTANLEEAASIAIEFISSLDNLPHEVQHLLAEIQHKDAKVHELQQEITRESAKYMRHSLRASGAPAQTLSQKDLSIPQLVRAHHAEIDQLSDEKIALAERIVRLIARAQVRLDADVQKVMVLQGEEPVVPQTASFYNATPARTPMTQRGGAFVSVKFIHSASSCKA